MDPVTGVLLLLLVSLALVGAGYWLGRVRLAPGAARRPAQAAAKHARAVPLAPAVTRRESSDWLQREIDQRVQALRRAREHAEPWRPPAVDAVEAPEHAIWFADTAVEPHTPAGPR
jgi:hypothetical protein